MLPAPGCSSPRVAEDPGDARVRVLDVVDGVLLRPLGREVDVELDRLVVAARDEVPARCVDADRVEELVEEDDVAAPLRHLLRLARPRRGGRAGRSSTSTDVARVAEHLRERLQARDVAVVVGAEHVDEPVEAARELPPDVGGVLREVRRRAVRADEDAVLVVAVRARARPQRPVLLVRVEQRASPRRSPPRPRVSRSQRVEVDRGSARASPRSARASPAPGRPGARRAPRCTRPGSRPPAAPRPRRTASTDARKRSICAPASL